MYTILWEFRPAAGKEKAFESAYGPDGVWPPFFAKGDGYVGTELLTDVERPGRYVTIDRWQSREHYETFNREHAAEYAEIDKRCEALTESEDQIGSFDSSATTEA